MDYETFGEHQWMETGIFDFMRALPARVFSHSNFTFNTPSEVSAVLQPVSAIYVPHPISWADEERDLTAWLGNDLQDEAFDAVYAIEHKVKAINDFQLMVEWRYLQTSDHFYYMCTKWFSDGDVHKYFNPYGTPYEAFINYMNVISDFVIRVDQYYENLKLTNTDKTLNIAEIETAQKNTLQKKSVKKANENNKVKVFSLNPLTILEDAEVRKIIKAISFETLAISLKGAKKDVRNKMIGFLSASLQKKLIAFDLSNHTKAEVYEARKVLMNEIKKYIS
jgi:alpha-amylase/alpha-mannosidase (GH57 family)